MPLPPISNALARQYPKALVLWLEEQRRMASDASILTTGSITTTNMVIDLDAEIIEILTNIGLTIGENGGVTVNSASQPDWELVGAVDALRVELILESFHRMIADAQAGAEPFQDGWRDALVDTSSIDATSSIRASFNSSFGFIEPSQYQEQQNQSGSSAVINTGGIIVVGEAITVTENIAVESASFRLLRVGGPGNGSTAFAKIYAVTGTVGSTAVPTGAALATSAGRNPNDFGTSEGFIEFTFSPAVNLVPGSYAFVYEETDFTNYDGSNYVIAGYKNTDVHSGNFFSKTGTTWTPQTYDLAFNVKLSGYANMTVVFVAYEADGEPSESQAILCVYSASAFTLNTDIIVESSLDNGSNWEAITMVLYGNYDSSGKEIIYGTEALTDRNDQTTILRIRTANNKNIQIHMVANLFKLQ